MLRSLNQYADVHSIVDETLPTVVDEAKEGERISSNAILHGIFLPLSGAQVMFVWADRVHTAHTLSSSSPCAVVLCNACASMATL